MEPGPRGIELYSGVSGRSRGWKARRVSRDKLQAHTLWNTANRASRDWECLRKDPDLWYSNGTCYVHLYAANRAQDAPEIRIPYSSLIAAGLSKFIECFVHHDNVTRQSQALETLTGRVDLYIPPPSNGDHMRHQVRIRNLLAWAAHKPLVGHHLGAAMVELVDTLAEYRPGTESNIDIVVRYLKETGYTDVRERPGQALAILHFAEEYHLDDLYTDAFAHCVGMGDMLQSSSEFESMNPVTRKSIERHSHDMLNRLRSAGSMLRTFLEEELSESYLGLSAGARAHLDRFRAYLHSHYMTRFGYYPPLSIQPGCTLFEPVVYQELRTDFEALYELLVDHGFSAATSSGFSSNGGICTLQSVHAFDRRHRFSSLRRPLPLIPILPKQQKLARTGSLFRTKRQPEKQPDPQMLSHVALLKATNKDNPTILVNPLVSAYRQFEEDCIFKPQRADRGEKINQEDARKVRWIVVYCIYQTLRSCTDLPPAVRDTSNLPYHINIPTTLNPPWHSASSVLRRSTTAIHSRGLSSSASSTFSSALSTASSDVKIEIKPDIDYLAVARRDEQTNQSSASPRPESQASCRSTTLTLRPRAPSFRRSISLFKATSMLEALQPPDTPASASSEYLDNLILGFEEDEFTTSEPRLGDASDAMRRTSPSDENLSSEFSDTKPQRSSSTSSYATADTLDTVLSAVPSTATLGSCSSTDTTLGPETPRIQSFVMSSPIVARGSRQAMLIGLGDYHLDLDDGDEQDDYDTTAAAIETQKQKQKIDLPLTMKPRQGSESSASSSRYSNVKSVYQAGLGPPSDPPNRLPPAIPRRNSKRHSTLRISASSPSNNNANADVAAVAALKQIMECETPKLTRKSPRRRLREPEPALIKVPDDVTQWNEVQMTLDMAEYDLNTWDLRVDAYSSRIEGEKDIFNESVWEQYHDLGGLRPIGFAS